MKGLRVWAVVSAVAVALLLAGLAGCGILGAHTAGASGTARPPARTADGGNGRLRMVPPLGPRSAFLPFRSTGADGTAVVTTRWHGRKSGFTGDIWAWVPPQYHRPEYARSGFPVLIALPGAWGYPFNYWAGEGFALEERIARWSRQGRTLPFIVVMPVLNPGKKYHDGSDIPGRPKMGTWLTEDVPAFARANFRTYDGREGWAFMGSSSGGFAALKAVLKYPQKFKAAVVNGPDTAPDSPMWRGHRAAKRANDPRRLARQLIQRHGPEIYLAFELGSDEAAVPDVKGFIRDHTGGPIHTTLFETPHGVHSGHTYLRRMAESLHWISEQMQGPVPSA